MDRREFIKLMIASTAYASFPNIVSGDEKLEKIINESIGIADGEIKICLIDIHGREASKYKNVMYKIEMNCGNIYFRAIEDLLFEPEELYGTVVNRIRINIPKDVAEVVNKYHLDIDIGATPTAGNSITLTWPNNSILDIV